MLIGDNIIVKGTHGFNDLDLQLIEAYLQGAVYCWCNTNGDEPFTARDFLGGENYYWQGTPLIVLYEYYSQFANGNDDYAIREAGKAAGRILKKVLKRDKRYFETEKKEGSLSRTYWWRKDLGEENNFE